MAHPARAWGKGKENQPTSAVQKGAWGKPVPEANPKALTSRASATQAPTKAQASARNPFQEKPVHLITNMFRMNEMKVDTLANKVNRYHMEVFRDGSQVEPLAASTNLERSLVHAMRLLPEFSGATLLTDGRSIVYSLTKLKHAAGNPDYDSTKSKTSEKTASVSDTQINVTVQHPVSKRKYKVTLRPAGWDANDALQKSQMLQVAIKYSFYEKNPAVLLRGKSLFNQEDYAQLGDLLLFTGTFLSCRFNGHSKPIINVDLSYVAAINSSVSVSQWMEAYAQRCRFRSFEEGMQNKNFAAGVQYYLKGLLAEVTYGNKATYRLDGLEEQLTPTTAKFTDKDGKETTVFNYYHSKYKKSLNKNGYLLVVKQSVKCADGATTKKQGSNRITYIPAELCKFTAGQKRKEDLDARERSEMINCTRKLPADRFSLLDKKVREIVQNTDSQNLDIGVDCKNIEVNARILRPKPIVYKGETLSPANGGWEIGKLYSVPKEPLPFGVVIDESMDKPSYERFVQLFMQVCQSVMFPVKTPVPLRVAKPETFESALRKNASKFAFFICVLPPRMASDLYPKIKALTCVELGAITQCVLDDRFKKKGADWVKIHDMSVLKNLVASINAKLDMENCIVAEAEMQSILSPVSPANLLVMGLDVYHGDTSDPEGKPSIVGLCASRNAHFNRYATVLRAQNPKQELVADKGVDIFSDMINEVMQARAGPLPKHVIFYRDGVGEGMYQAVLEHEVQTLQIRLAELYAAQKLEAPKLTFIITQKRNHFRTRDVTSRDGNPPPGALVDDLVVVDEDFPNFYLYSHKALAGTARPTHYHILLDENKFAKDQIASFSYALTHLHQGCTKSVSLPAPVYYADLACYLAGTCFRQHVADLHGKTKVTSFMI